LAGIDLPQRRIPLSMKSSRRLLSEFLQYQQRTWFVGEFMTKVDGGAMRHALEARSPFLDQKLWEFAATLPAKLRLRGGTLKAILREIVRRRVGPEVASRTKQGFTVPVEQWLATHWTDAVDQLSHGPALEIDGWIRPGAIQSYLSASTRDQAVPTQIWHLLALESWLQRNRRLAPASLGAASAGRANAL
jgi:asparagine synthase (glutamine-hydrolysing)